MDRTISENELIINSDEEPPHPANSGDHEVEVVIPLSDIEAEDVSWLWPGRVPLSHFTLIAGDPGCGKTSLFLDCASRLSRGTSWPDGSPAPQGRTLFMTAEDGLADTVRPRVDRYGGDPSQILIFDGVRDRRGKRPLDLVKHLHLLVRAIRKYRPLLVGIDPITAYFGKTDSHKDAEMRGLLTPLIAAVHEYKVALVGIGHLNKGQMQSALYRPGGSIAIVAASRMAFAVAADPEDEDRRVVASLKANLCEKPESLAFRIGEHGVLQWEDGPVLGLDADQLFSRPKARKEEDATEAEQLLQSLLDDASRWPLAAASAFELASQQGISKRTLQRAAQGLGIRPRRLGFGKGSRVVWQHPSSALAPMASMENQAGTIIDASFSVAPMEVAPMESVASMDGSDSGGNLHTRHRRQFHVMGEDVASMERFDQMPHPADDDEKR